MTKLVHPIRKMRRDLERKHYLCRIIWPPSNQTIEKDIARHVKPLLDALEEAHNGHHIDALYCEPCRLLAAWRAKLND
jgi:hypothetical protein